MKITDELSDQIAAGFSIGAQTSYSMIRRTNITYKEKALVFSGRSNTSLFITKSLLKLGIDTTVLTTSEWTKDQEEFIKPARLLKIERIPKKKLWEELKIGKYDVIFDPFFDLHLLTSVNMLNLNGRYITCGFKNQHNYFKEEQDDFYEINTMNVMLSTMINNLSIIGNYIGTTQDLYDQIHSYDAKNPIIAIDKILDINEGSEFLDSTYNNKNRFGKVIMKYI